MSSPNRSNLKSLTSKGDDNFIAISMNSSSTNSQLPAPITASNTTKSINSIANPSSISTGSVSNSKSAPQTSPKTATPKSALTPVAVNMRKISDLISKKMSWLKINDRPDTPQSISEKSLDIEEINGIYNDEILEGARLEKIVDKLTRIAEHAVSGSKLLIENDHEIDEATAAWLIRNYSEKHASINPQVLNDMVRVFPLRTIPGTQSQISWENLNSWQFNVLNYSNEDLSKVISTLFNQLRLLQEFNIPNAIFQAFLKELTVRYLENAYHNFKHGCDVCHTSYRLIMIPELNLVLSSIEVLSLLVGAISHDVGHLGVSNDFLINTNHELALIHNDRSPLENMHCVVLYEILSKPATNIFVNLSTKQWRAARKFILTIILATDMTHHPQHVTKTELFYEVHGEDSRGFCAGIKDEMECMKEDKNRLFLLELVLHCADLSNPYRSFEISTRWGELIATEYFLLGDREKSEGLAISPGCDREQVILCNMQMGFIEIAVTPLITAFLKLFPPLHEIGSNMVRNFRLWGERRRKEIEADPLVQNKEEVLSKLEQRVFHFQEKMNFIDELKTIPIRGNKTGWVSSMPSPERADSHGKPFTIMENETVGIIPPVDNMKSDSLLSSPRNVI